MDWSPYTGTTGTKTATPAPREPRASQPYGFTHGFAKEDLRPKPPPQSKPPSPPPQRRASQPYDGFAKGFAKESLRPSPPKKSSSPKQQQQRRPSQPYPGVAPGFAKEDLRPLKRQRPASKKNTPSSPQLTLFGAKALYREHVAKALEGKAELTKREFLLKLHPDKIPVKLQNFARGNVEFATHIGRIFSEFSVQPRVSAAQLFSRL